MVKTENTTLGLACFIPFIGLDILQGVPNNSHSFDFHHNLVTSQQFKSITCSRVVLTPHQPAYDQSYFPSFVHALFSAFQYLPLVAAYIEIRPISLLAQFSSLS